MVTEVSERMSVLVREEIELAKAEVTQKVNSIVKGAVAIAAGAVFGVFALIFGLLAVAWAINDAFGHLWPGFVIVFAGLLGMTIAAFVFARRWLGVGAPKPVMAIDEAKKIRETVATRANGEGAPAKVGIEMARTETERAEAQAEAPEAKPETAEGEAPEAKPEKAEGEAGGQTATTSS